MVWYTLSRLEESFLDNFPGDNLSGMLLNISWKAWFCAKTFPKTSHNCRRFKPREFSPIVVFLDLLRTRLYKDRFYPFWGVGYILTVFNGILLFSKLAGKCGNFEGFKIMDFFSNLPHFVPSGEKFIKKLCEILTFLKKDEISELKQKNRDHIKTGSASSRKNITLILQNAEKYRQIQLESVISKVRTFLRKRMMMRVFTSHVLVR